MAGEAKTTSFMLGSATVMIGAQTDLFTLNPDDNSIGLVKNFTMTSEPGYTDLTQGVKNQIVYSVMTSNTVKAQMEVYEYTSKNIAYALGLNGSALAAQTIGTTVGTAYVALAATISVVSAVGLAVGDYIAVQEGTDDKVFFRKITTIATNVLTLSSSIPKAIAVGATVKKVNAIDIGSKQDQPFLSAKIVGSLADGTEIGIMIPKLRITNGFTMGFVTDNYGNLPFEFTVYDLVSTDANYAEFSGKQAMLFTNK